MFDLRLIFAHLQNSHLLRMWKPGGHPRYLRQRGKGRQSSPLCLHQGGSHRLEGSRMQPRERILSDFEILSCFRRRQRLRLRVVRGRLRRQCRRRELCDVINCFASAHTLHLQNAPPLLRNALRPLHESSPRARLGRAAGAIAAAMATTRTSPSLTSKSFRTRV